MTTLQDLLYPALEGSRTAVESLTGNRLTGAQICEQARSLAAGLAENGISKNEPVLLKIRNEPEDIAGYLGIWEAGAVAVPYHATSPDIAVSALSRRAGSRFEIAQASLHALTADGPPTRSQLDGAAIIVFTSGSTGMPKGVILGHEALTFKLGALSRLLNLKEEDAVLCPLQLTFIFGIWVTLLGLLSGSRIILVPKFAANAVSELLDGVTVLAVVPTMLRALVQLPGLSSPGIKKVLTGGEPLGLQLSGKVKIGFPGAEIFDLYGLTETGSCDFCLTPANQPAGLGTIGRPTKGVDFQIGRVSGYSFPREGELEIRTPSRMIGYLDDPELTASAFNGEYFKTGDLARLREDGFVELIGRHKEIILRGGNKIAPLEIDAAFAQHSAVSAVMTTSLPDPILGESVHVLVVKKDGAGVSPADLREWAIARLEKFKVPDGIHFVSALPLGPTGKADRKSAAQLIEAKYADRTK